MRPDPTPAPAFPPRAPLTALLAGLLLGPAVMAQGETGPTPIAIFAGHVHPVSGPVIRDGVVLILDDLIVAVGPRDKVAVPDGARAFSYPEGHVYPGLVDAASDAWLEQGPQGDGSTDAGSPLVQALGPGSDYDRQLASCGVTTAFVGSRAPVAWRGLGVVLRPRPDGYEVWEGREQAAVQARLTAGPGASHPLQRQAAADGMTAQFTALEPYEKALADHKKALEKYQKDFEEYLAFHRKKSGGNKEGEAPAEAPREGAGAEGRPGRTRPGAGTGTGRPGTPPGERGGSGGERRGPPRAQPAGGTPDQPAPAQNPAPAAGQGQPAQGDGAAEKAPARPTFPKEPSRDPAKDALLKVKQGELPLRVEAHRLDEIRAALNLRGKHELPQMVLEQAYGAAPLATQLAEAGVPCILTDVSDADLPADYRRHESFDLARLPAALHAAGVAVAIASGSSKRARWLPLMAATAVGGGLDADAALRAITLTPAEILGVARETGSLDAGKLADLIVCDRPLFASDCRLLRVMSAGDTAYEAK